MTGKLTRQCIVASTVFVDHVSDFSYVYHQTSTTSEETLKSKETEASLLDEDETVEEEDFPTYSQDLQEYMHWHYRLNHPTHTVMIKMAKQNMLPRRITKILVDMGKQHSKPPMCNDCCGAKATRRPWRGKSNKYNVSKPGILSDRY